MTRLKYIDILKGVSILCIVLMHFEEGVFPLWLCVWIGSFMVTAFFFTSGWLLSAKGKVMDVKAFFKKRFRSLGIPYLWFSALILLFDLILLLIGFYDRQTIYRDLCKTFMLRGIGTLWFLPALLFGETIFVYLRNKDRRWLWAIALVLSLVYLHYYWYWNGHYRNMNSLYKILDTPFHAFHNAIRAWIVIACGYKLQQLYRRYLSHLSSLFDITLGVGLCAVSVYLASFLPFNPDAFNIFLAPVVGPFGLLLVAKGVERMKVCCFFDYWGKNSLALMATHFSIVLVLFQILNQHLYGETKLTGISSLVFFVLAMMIEYPIVEVINKRFRFLLGK